MRTVLVIGAGGLVGSHVRTGFSGERVLATYRRAVPPSGIQIDVTDHEAVRTLIDRTGPDVIVLAAAETFVERCEREPATTRLVNVDAARAVAEAARAVGAMLVVFSSEYVFDGTKGRYTEADPVRPLNEYGRQKADLEDIARGVERHLICRTSGVYGWEPARKNFVCQMLDHVRAGRRFTVPSDQLVTPTYAIDLATALVRAIDLGATGTLHLVGPRILPRLDFARLVCDAFGLPAEFVSGRLTEELGLAAPRPQKAGLADERLRGLDGPMREPEHALRDMRDRSPAPV